MESSQEPKVKTMVEKADTRVYCFACQRTGSYYKVNGNTFKRISATMRKTERGYAHVDCLA